MQKRNYLLYQNIFKIFDIKSTKRICIPLQMRCSIAILLLCTLSFTPKGQTVSVGEGSYTTTFPGTDEAGRNTYPSGTPQVSGNAANKPISSNTWWANFMKEDHGGQAYNYPLSFRSESDGLVINYTIPLSSSASEYREPMSDVDGIKVGVDALDVTQSTVSDYSDWTVTTSWADDSHSFTAQMGMGMPFVYFTKGSANTASVDITYNSGSVSTADNKILIENNLNNSSYVVFGPSGSNWSLNGTTYTSDLNGKDYWSIALVPDGMDIDTFISNYEKYAFVFPQETNVDWTYDNNTSVVTTTFTVEPDVKEGSYSTVLLGLLPHQWAHLGSGSPQPNSVTYHTVRGELKLLESNSFTVQNTFSGILPTLPNLAKYSEGFDVTALYEKIDAMKDDALPSWTDSYNEGQNMNRLIQAARIADQIGYTAARDKLLDTVEERLEDWLKAESGEVAFLFYYNDTWNAMLGYPAGHSQDSNLNDHHFHWGYFIHAASALEQFRPGWADSYGDMVNLLVKDAGNYDKSDTMFPFLRNFSPYAGHAWANGFATEPFGNDQESTSESMQFNASLIHWGTITNNEEIKELGIYLYTTEITAIQEYWFDINNRTFQPEYTYEMMARIWGAGYDNGTWWTTDVAASYGIQLYPIHGGALYMGYDLDYVQEVWSGMTSNTEVLSNTANDNLWYDTYWSFLAFSDPELAISLYNDYTDRSIKVGMSDAQTYHWLHTMNAMGHVADEITADYPIAAVFEKDGEKTYVAHNYGTTDIVVTFSDGYTLSVPAATMATSRDTGITIEIDAPDIVAEPCTSGVNADFTLTANTGETTASYVEFYRNGALIATDSEAPYSLEQHFDSDGEYTYLAKAYITDGFEWSNVFEVIVGLGSQTPYSEVLSVPGTFQSGYYDAGGNGISYYDVDANEGEADFRTDDEVDAATSDSQGTSIGWISAGEWLEYSIDATAGMYDIGLNLASNASEGGTSGTVNIQIDCNDVGDITETPLTGAWDSFEQVTLPNVSLTAGTHILRITFTDGVYNLGNITFTRTGDSDDDNTAPTSPSDLATTNITANSISIAWNASTDAEGNLSGYQVYLDGQLEGLIEDTSYTFTDLVASTSYEIEVQAIDEEGLSSQLISITATTSSEIESVTIPARIEAESYTDMYGVELETTTDEDGGQNVGYIAAGDWMEYVINAPETTEYTLDFRVASQDLGGTFDILVDDNTSGTVSFDATGGWQVWTTVSTSLTLSAGTHTIKILANSAEWNINWLEFTSESTDPVDDGCSVTVNDDFSVEISSDSNNPGITFIPEVSGVGATTCILYYSTDPGAVFPGYLVEPNTAYTLTASEGQTVYYYYTYNLAGGGEDNTADNIQSFVVGSCVTESARLSMNESLDTESTIVSAPVIYPNPAQTYITISGVTSGTTVSIFTLSGKSVLESPLKSTSNNMEIDVSGLNQGIYIIKIDGHNKVMKLIID